MKKDFKNNDLKFIKKHYGENFAHLCRELFPTLLEHEGLLTEILTKNFAFSKSLYDYIIMQKGAFKYFIYNLAGLQPPVLSKTSKTPKELLDEAGYILYDECKTEDDINYFKKYYRPDEELCTFRGDRLDTCRVWFAVKKNVDEIKREDFKFPKRQDEYGTSVISIQFGKEDGSLSIKNRYNHKVPCPDATFSNNLENIIEGLTLAFEKEYQINHMGFELELKDFFRGEDNKYYLINYKDNGLYYGENNVLVDDGKLIHIDKSKYLLIDKYLIDFQNNCLKIYDKDAKQFTVSDEDSFINSIGEISKISISKDTQGRKIIIITPKEGEDVEITINRRNEIIGYKNHNVKEIEDDFLASNKEIEFIDLPKVEAIGDNFLFNNRKLTKLNLPSVEKVKSNFIYSNQQIDEVNLPNLKTIKSYFLYENNNLTSLYLPKVEEIDTHFIDNNYSLKKVDFPCVKKIGSYFISRNKIIEEVNMPNLITVKHFFLYDNLKLKNLSLPNLEEVDISFLNSNKILNNVEIPKLKTIGDSFLCNNRSLKNIDLPNAVCIGNSFMYKNNSLNEISLPSAILIGNNFLFENKNLQHISMPEVEKIEGGFLYFNELLNSFYAPKLKEIGYDCLRTNKSLKSIELPMLTKIGFGFLEKNNIIKYVSIPNISDKSMLSSRISKYLNKNRVKKNLIKGDDYDRVND